MTVNPGWGGQAFIASSPDKVSRLAAAGRRGEDRGRRRHRRRHGRLGCGRRRVAVRGRLGGLRRRRSGGRLRRDRRRRGRGLTRTVPHRRAGSYRPRWRVTTGASLAGDRRDQRPRHLLPPGALGFVDAGPQGATRAPVGELAAPAERHVARPVTAKRPSARATSAPGSSRRRAQLGARPRRRRSPPARLGRRRASCPGRTEKICGAPRGGSSSGAGSPSGPSRQSRVSSLDLVAAVLLDEDVQLVAGLDARSSRAARRRARRGRSGGPAPRAAAPAR